MTPLRTKMIADLRATNLPASIQELYIKEVAAMALASNTSPDLLSPKQVRAYLEDCARQLLADKLAALEYFYTETLGREWDVQAMMPRPPKPQSLACPVRQRMDEDMRLRNLAPKTRTEYDRWVGKFAAFHGASPDSLGMDDVRDYLVHLMDVEGKSASSYGVASAALRFCYAKTLRRDWALDYIPLPKREKILPVIPSLQEMLHFIAAAQGVRDRAIVMTTYGAGLRTTEVARLKVTDIDSQRMMIRVEQGKGRKDRYVMLSQRLLEELRLYWKAARSKEWLFQGRDPSRPITGGCVRVAVKRTAQAANLDKPMTPRTLRHAFATHLLESGMRLPQIQLLMGHRSIRSTQIYARLAISTVCSGQSPLDLLSGQQ
jgi:site-specific recombinase XerD